MMWIGFGYAVGYAGTAFVVASIIIIPINKRRCPDLACARDDAVGEVPAGAMAR